MTGQLERAGLTPDASSASGDWMTRVRAALDGAAIGVAQVSPDGAWLWMNQRVCAMLHCTPEEARLTTFRAFTHPDDLAASDAAMAKSLSEAVSNYTLEKRYLRADGSTLWARVTTSLVREADGRPSHFISLIEDVTERHDTSERLGRLNQLYRVLRQVNATIARATDESSLLGMACEDAVKHEVFDTAGVFLLDPVSQVARPVAAAGRGREYLGRISVTTDDGVLSRGTIGTALRTGMHDICNDIVADPRMSPWRDAAVAFGHYATASFPLKRRDAVVGVLVLFASNAGYFGEAEVGLLTSVADDLSLALSALAEERERVEAERRLRESEERYRTLVENSHDLIWAVNAEGRLTFISQSCRRLYGYEPEELLGRPFTDWVPADQLAKDQEAFARAVALGEGTVDYESRVVRKDGVTTTWSANATILRNERGDFVGVSGISRDVTELRQREAEERVRSERQRRSDALVRMAGNAAHVGGWLIEIPSDDMQWSDELYAILGVPTGMPPSLDRGIGLYLPEWRERVQDAIGQCRAHGTSFDLEAQMQTPDGRQLWVRLLGEAERDESGTICRVQGALQDITAQKTLERQLLRAQRVESLGTLAGGIAHDLNNVLAPILLSIEFLRLPASDAERAGTLDIIEGSARRGADMVRQVLAFARGVEGRRTIVRPAELIRDVVRLVTDTFPRDVAVRCVIADDVRSVEGDPTQLHQVLLNLAVNARDAMPGGGRLEIRAANVALDSRDLPLEVRSDVGGWVVITMEDSGTGMSPETVQRIFDPFFTTKAVGEGTGLGLSTSQAIIRSHGGFLKVYSEMGRGSTFSLYLPRASGDALAAPEDDVGALPRGDGELVLVVDDEAAVRDITRQTLESFGYRVLLARDGAEALAIYATRGNDVDLVLTDMMMPVMDGIATITVLLRLNPAVRVICASGLGANGQAVKAASLGIKHFLPKPYSAHTLLRVLRDVLDGPPPD